MFNTPCQDHRRQPFWNKLVAIVALVGVLGFFSVHAEPVHAAVATPPPAFPSVDQIYGGHPAAYHPTPTEKAYAADKVQLSNEYGQRVLSGKETLAAFETHYRAFMTKWHLGNVANLHTMLTRSATRLRSTAGRLIRPQCVSVNGITCVTPVGAAQFPEESWNWCGPATLSTTLVEDSFAWPGTNSYSGFTLSYNQYAVTQPSNLATNDEYWLATHGVISGDTYNNGTSFSQMTTMLNNFVGGKGGWYAQEFLSGPLQNQIADFQGKVASDIGTGWDVPTGIDIGAGSFNSMPGYPYNHSEIQHWVPVTFISSDHNTTYYSDPVYGAPAYSGWSVPAPYESTSTSNLVWYAMGILW
jgi:hypothetical protein